MTRASQTIVLLSLFFLPLFFLPLFVAAQEDDLSAEVVISVQQDEVFWTGQQVTVNLDLKTTGLSFSNTHFNLPEVSGAFLMQTDTTTIKISETIANQAWQIIRYPLALYPQKSGQLEIPPIIVRFNTSAGFGSTEKSFELETKPINVTVKSPPGVSDGDIVITTTSFELEHSWQPQSKTAKPGDAFTLTITRRASEISGMLLPPLPVFRTEGLAAYPQTPQVNDKTNRGDLTGERVDSIIWVAEKPGSLAIPGIRFKWWDPGSQELKQLVAPGLTLDILPSDAGNAETDTLKTHDEGGAYYLWFVLIAIAAGIAGFLWVRFGFKQSHPTLTTEKSTFSTLQKACRSNKAGQAYSALHVWLACTFPAALPNSAGLTLGGFGRHCGDMQLAAELDLLQMAVINTDSNWQGNNLYRALRRNRRHIKQQKIVQSEVDLAPLNP
jgi:hypothetical protein